MEVIDTSIRKVLSRPYILVLRRSRQELTVRVDVYPAALKDGMRPLISGMIEFGRKRNNLLEIRRSWFVRFNKPVYYQPKEFHGFLRTAKGIVIPRESQPDFLEDLRDFLSRIQTSQPRIVSVCMHCLRNDRLSVLTKSNAVRLSETDIACVNCAIVDLKIEIKGMGVSLSKGMLRQLEFLVRKAKSVPKVLETLSPGFDPTKESDLTLFDRIDTVTKVKTRKISGLPLSDELKQLLLASGYNKLLPVQDAAIQAGLLKGKNLLIVSSTSSGKTLIGELAGIPRSLRGEKMLYLSPLVALTNEKYELFKKRYRKLGLRTGIKVGMSRLDVGNEGRPIVDTDISKADIVCATYEALDLLFRARDTTSLGKIGVVIVDEIQNLADPERGAELDGLLVRLRHFAPNAQIIALSATVGTPKRLAEELELRLVNVPGRPVPLERHIVFARNDEEKRSIVRQLVISEYKTLSSTGHRGQSIVFTYSRRRAHALSDWLRENGVRATVYHGGLSYYRRRRVEQAYAQQKYACVVTTAALGAGVDFPASQVIFESLAMGSDWLSIAEFEQMLGRAGRLGKHDRGKVYLIVEPERKYHAGQDRTEDAVAIELLSGAIEDVEPFADLETSAEQALATICATGVTKLEDVARVYNKLLSASVPPSDALKFLIKRRMIRVQNGVHVTALGKATTLSFLKPTQGVEVLKLCGKMDTLDIAIKLEPFENVYLSSRLQGELNATFRTHLPTRFFNNIFTELNDLSSRSNRRLSKWVLEIFSRWTRVFFNCGCSLYPECDHAKIKLGHWIVEQRRSGLNPTGLAKKLHDDFELWAYPGDIFSWLDTLIYNLKAVQRIAAVAGKIDLEEKIEGQIAEIERPLSARNKN